MNWSLDSFPMSLGGLSGIGLHLEKKKAGSRDVGRDCLRKGMLKEPGNYSAKNVTGP